MKEDLALFEGHGIRRVYGEKTEKAREELRAKGLG